MSVWAVAVTALVVFNIGFVLAGRERRRANLDVLRSLRPWMFLANLPVIALVVLVATVLHQVPLLGWGWYRLVTGEGDGNAAVVAASGNLWVFVPFLALFAAAVPYFALDEERLFRDGTTGTASALRRSVVFGLMHCIVGVSIAIGLALAVAGLWYTHQFRKGGIERAAAYHCAWNYTVLAVIGAGLVVEAAS